MPDSKHKSKSLLQAVCYARIRDLWEERILIGSEAILDYLEPFV